MTPARAQRVRGATCIPTIGLGATRNPELIRAVGEATAAAVAATGIDWIFGPTVAQAQDFRWGRSYESYSDDSELVSQYAYQLVEGIKVAGWRPPQHYRRWRDRQRY